MFSDFLDHFVDPVSRGTECCISQYHHERKTIEQVDLYRTKGKILTNEEESDLRPLSASCTDESEELYTSG